MQARFGEGRRVNVLSDETTRKDFGMSKEMNSNALAAYSTSNDTCLCFEDEQNKEQLAQAIKDGLITPDDANRIMKGETI